MTPALLQLLPVMASLVLATGTVFGLVWGVWTYRRNGQAQLQLLALGVLQRYLDLAVAHPELATHDAARVVDARYAWFAAHALTTAQLLWTLVGREPDWQRSIDAIIRQHRAYLRSGAFVCADFNPGFVAFLRTRVADLACAAPDGA